MSIQRLDRFISNQLSVPRKEVKEGIRKGRAQVSGKVITSPDYSVDTENAGVVYSGQAVRYKQYVYIVMNKPVGVLSASEDKRRQTVIDLIPKEIKRKGLFPVGRLDKDTTGLLIITDDGDFAHSVLSPKKEIYKTYIAELDGEITGDIVRRFSDGITLADGTVCRKAFLRPLGEKKAEIKICEGKFHQIKRMFGTVGLGVNSLERTAMGDFKLPDNLLPGECKEIQKNQLIPLFCEK